MKATLTATLIAALAAPAMAGGPVIIEDTTEVVTDKPATSIGVLPIVLILTVALVAASGGGDDCSYRSTC